MRGMMKSGGGGCFTLCCGGGGGILVSNGRRLLSKITGYQTGWIVVVVILFVSVVESVPTVVGMGGGGGGQKEVVVMSGRSLYWPYNPFSGDGHHLGREEKRNQNNNLQPIQLCGYRLLEAVRGLCRGNYVGFSRRSDPDMEDDEHSSRIQAPHRHRHHHPRPQQEHLHRVRRNIIDECCMKPCSVNEMLRYCGRT